MNRREDYTLVVLVALLACVGLIGKFGLPTNLFVTTTPVVVPAKVTAATYFYEKDDGGVPSPVSKAMSKLNELGIVATTFEEDATNPSGKIPKQYEVSLPAARTAGLPALVVTAGDKLRVVKNPTTEAQVLEAAK